MVKIDKEIFESATKIIGVSDDVFEFQGDVYVDDEYIESVLEDLVTEYHRKEEELEDEIEQRENYYTPKSPYDIYGVNENDYV